MNYREDNPNYRLHKKAPATPMMAAGAITFIPVSYILILYSNLPKSPLQYFNLVKFVGKGMIFTFHKM